MSLSEKLRARFGGNVRESMGHRPSAPATPAAPAGPNPGDGRTRDREAATLELARITPDPAQPRQEFDEAELDRLAESLKRHGQLLPLRVRWDGSLGKHVIISGERRYRAALKAGLKTVAAICVERELSEADRLSEQLVENLLRVDLRPVEQAKAFQRLKELHGWDNGDLVRNLAVTHDTVSRALSLLKLPESVQEQVDVGVIPARSAAAVARLPTPEAQVAMAERIVEEKLNVTEAVEAVQQVFEAAAEENAEPLPEEELKSEEPAEDLAVPSGELNPTDSHNPTPARSPKPAHPPTGKPGRPKAGPKEFAFRTDRAKVTVEFRRSPTDEDIIAAMEEVIEQIKARSKPKAAVTEDTAPVAA